MDASRIESSHYGTTADGDSVTLFRLTNPSGAYLEVIDYGCRLIKLFVPDREGVLDDVVLGYGSLEEYETAPERFMGCLLGRYANRIAGGRFRLDSTLYQLTCNEAPNRLPGHLHGGFKGFDRVMWQAESFSRHDTVGVRFHRLSPDGEEGYPGNLTCDVIYYWLPNNTLRIEYSATTDKPTIVNLSQHIYFNLKGRRGGTVLDNELTVAADSMTPNNKAYVPTGEIVPVSGTPLDFRDRHTFLERINQPNAHIQLMGGYSANWVLRNQSGQLAKAASLKEPASSRILETWTTEPGLLIYTGINLSQNIIGKYGALSKYGGILFETLHYPNTPNEPLFPSCTLRPTEVYRSITEYRFRVDR
ncbi:MAG: galactose mutarotase [Dysgonamonadaceae bacterium]|nr:galactose mutarotase [Dysgonamonadaceae bacterium]